MRTLNRVLLIEDDPGDARLVTEYLRDRFDDDCDLQVVSTLASGLDCLPTAAYDVILLDLCLPASTGLRTFFEVNARAARLLVRPIDGCNASSESLFGRSLYDFVEPSQVATLQDLLATVQGQRQSRELQLRCEGGTLIWVMAAASRAPLSPGSRGDLVLMLTDITDRRLKEVELQAFRVDLEARVDERTFSLQALNADLEAFSVSVAHDLRTPLNGILGFAALMQIDQQHPLAAPQAQPLHIIEQSARSMGELIGGLLQLARLGRQAMVIGPLDLSAKAQLIVRNLEASEPVREVNWQIDPGLTAPGDSRLLEVLLSNLLGNAWKYSAQVANASIHFGVLESPGSAPPFFVRDNGVGFDPTESGELFTPFHRLPSAGAYVGSGVGLATVRRVVERHGGRAWADGRPGKGACSYFSLQPNMSTTVSP